MTQSVFDIFKLGIGPSSSHTMGPMLASKRFVDHLDKINPKNQINSITVELFGSLALTGIGHSSDKAIILGLIGYTPQTVDFNKSEANINKVKILKKLELKGKCFISFDPKRDIKFLRRKTLPLHPNGMIFKAFNKNNNIILQKEYYSIGGGRVVCQNSLKATNKVKYTNQPHQFTSAHELLKLGKEKKISFAKIAFENELTNCSSKEIKARLNKIISTMEESINRGCSRTGQLPGKLNVKRRAKDLHQKLQEKSEKDPLKILDWVSLFALAVSEENASGDRIVTAPTNGAAGVIPAVLLYYKRFVPKANEEGCHDFLLVAGIIGILYANNASLSGAEVGCQGEVGVACSMAAGGLTAVLGGSNLQVEQAAEIAMEHNLGLTCDPIGGLVQIPCIERNAMAATKAISSARIALNGDGTHYVSLDQVMKTMMETGADMKTKYKETSRGGLAVNFTEC